MSVTSTASARVGRGRRQTIAALGALIVLAAAGYLVRTQANTRTTPATGEMASTTADTAAANGAVPTGSIPLGPGPMSPYTVQTQPPAGSCHYRYQDGYPLPDPACTPGARNPKVTQDTLTSTICRSGYTSSIRPPVSITSREKSANARSYGYTGSTATAEYDHLISLELGGDPNDARNLWIEPNDKRAATTTNNGKDAVENAAHTAICTGRVTLLAAQTGIATNWVAFGRQLGLDLPAVR